MKENWLKRNIRISLMNCRLKWKNFSKNNKEKLLKNMILNFKILLIEITQMLINMLNNSKNYKPNYKTQNRLLRTLNKKNTILKLRLLN